MKAPRGPADTGIVDSSAALASLYQAPFAEFVPRRSALVAQLKKSGHKEVAARLATAAKPSRAAYLLNQVFWRARSTYEGLLDAGSAARAAQQARLLGETGQDLTASLHLRDAAVDSAVAEAERIAAEEGLAASEAITAQVRASFEALAAHGREGRLPHGQLVSDVELPGLAALAGLVLPASAAPSRQFQVVARRAEPAPSAPAAPDPRVIEAEARVEDLRERERSATERVDELARSVAACRTQVEEAEAALTAATRRLEQARQTVSQGETAHSAALRDLEVVRAARADAESQLGALTTSPDDNGAPSGGRPTSQRGRRPRG